ncbi:MAG: WYL domain-containing protein [Frankiaceae bacterium]|nr:WYL domain-containing protein [Frankiaceae bacterium]
MAARRAERLVNLVLCLLSTRQFLTAEQIRRSVPGYQPADGAEQADEAFHRMFERDKGELRELGVPLEVGRNSYFDPDEGYRITRRSYELPAIEFTPQEAAAVGLAIRLWRSAPFGAAAHGALVKLRAAGVRLDPAALPAALPPLDAAEPALPVLLEALRARRAVRFGYRKPTDSSAQRRLVEPWGVVSWRARWYLVGLDRGRAAPRCFRLSRIEGAVRASGPPGAFDRPADVDLRAIVAARPPEPDRHARVRLVGEGAEQLRRFALASAGAAPSAQVVEIPYGDVHWMARQIAAAGPSAVALDPPELVGAVLRLLRAAAGEPETAAPAAGQ